MYIRNNQMGSELELLPCFSCILCDMNLEAENLRASRKKAKPNNLPKASPLWIQMHSIYNPHWAWGWLWFFLYWCLDPYLPTRTKINSSRGKYTEKAVSIYKENPYSNCSLFLSFPASSLTIEVPIPHLSNITVPIPVFPQPPPSCDSVSMKHSRQDDHLKTTVIPVGSGGHCQLAHLSPSSFIHMSDWGMLMKRRGQKGTFMFTS